MMNKFGIKMPKNAVKDNKKTIDLSKKKNECPHFIERGNNERNNIT